MRAKPTGVCLVTADVLALCRFYADALGAEIEGDARHAFVHLTDGSMAVFSEEGMEEMAPGSTAGMGAGRCILGFEVDDVDAAHTRMLDLGAPVIMPPTAHSWGRRSAWYRDPDGNIVDLHQPA